MDEQQPTIKLVVLDIDGTLLNSDHHISDRNKRAIQAAMDAGIKVVLATGRTSVSGKLILDELKLNTYGIWMQGLVIHDEKGDTFYQKTLDPVAMRRVITFAEDRDFPVVAYSGDRVMIRARNQRVTEGLRVYREPEPEPVGPLHNLIETTPINKLMMLGDPRRLKALRWQLNAQLNGAIRLMQAGVPHMLEVMPPGTSKGAALRALLKELGISPAEVMALGDAENDIEMIEFAGLGVAVANAEPAVKRVAKHITASNDDDGVCLAIEQFVLKRSLDEPVADEAAAPTPLTPDEDSTEAAAAPVTETAAETPAESAPSPDAESAVESADTAAGGEDAAP
jgi:hypothetical protein